MAIFFTDKGTTATCQSVVITKTTMNRQKRRKRSLLQSWCLLLAIMMRTMIGKSMTPPCCSSFCFMSRTHPRSRLATTQSTLFLQSPHDNDNDILSTRSNHGMSTSSSSLSSSLYQQQHPIQQQQPHPQLHQDNPDHRRTNIPRHVAFICDGNSRWAHHRGLQTRQGHVQGADRLVQLLEQLREDGISYCTLYGFSTENWKRSHEEVQEIFAVMEATAKVVFPRILQTTITATTKGSKEKDGDRKNSNRPLRIKILGDLEDERIPGGLRQILQKLQRMTANPSTRSTTTTATTTTRGKQRGLLTDDDDDDAITVCLAINYGGRQDIVQATKKMLTALQAGEISLQDFNISNREEDDAFFASFLSTSGIPDPDLIIRTSGEYRLSNFLLWNSAYSEFYVTDTLWPDFDIQCWEEALQWYQQRSRRFGSRQSSTTSSQ